MKIRAHLDAEAVKKTLKRFCLYCKKAHRLCARDCKLIRFSDKTRRLTLEKKLINFCKECQGSDYLMDCNDETCFLRKHIWVKLI